MDKEKQEQQRKIWAAIIKKAWSDKDFKKKLEDNPHKVLKEEGFEIQKDIEYSIIEDTAHHKHLVIPKKPTSLKEQELKGMTGGMTSCISSCKGIIAGCCVTCGVCACKGIITCFCYCNPVTGSSDGKGGSGKT